MWIPGDVGLAGNSAAYIAVKAALLLSVSNLTVPHLDYNSLINKEALKLWQLRWNCETQNKLHAIKPRVNVINLFHLPRRDKIVIHRYNLYSNGLNSADVPLSDIHAKETYHCCKEW